MKTASRRIKRRLALPSIELELAGQHDEPNDLKNFVLI